MYLPVGFAHTYLTKHILQVHPKILIFTCHRVTESHLLRRTGYVYIYFTYTHILTSTYVYIYTFT